MTLMAPPTRLTTELRVDLERQLADGVPVAVVAQRFGIGRRTLTRWIADGHVVRRVDPTPEPAPAVTSFGEQFDRAEPGLVGVVAAAHRGSWQAASWLLERRFAEVDQLAERRRRHREPTMRPTGR